MILYYIILDIVTSDRVDPVRLRGAGHVRRKHADLLDEVRRVGHVILVRAGGALRHGRQLLRNGEAEDDPKQNASEEQKRSDRDATDPADE